jgi:hypothetical protein
MGSDLKTDSHQTFASCNLPYMHTSIYNVFIPDLQTQQLLGKTAVVNYGASGSHGGPPIKNTIPAFPT